MNEQEFRTGKKMDEKNFEIGSQWRTRGGWMAIVVEHIANKDYPFLAHHPKRGQHTHDADGETDRSGYTELDLIEPWVEPQKGERWVNFYGDGSIHTFASEVEAFKDSSQYDDLLARKRITWTEGDME